MEEERRVVGPAEGAGLRRQAALGVVAVVARQGELLQVVAALDAGGGLAHLLDGRHQQADQNGDDGDHDEQLDQREGGAHARAEKRVAP